MYITGDPKIVHIAVQVAVSRSGIVKQVGGECQIAMDPAHTWGDNALHSWLAKCTPIT